MTDPAPTGRAPALQVVIDTNILVARALPPQGAGRRRCAIRACVDGTIAKHTLLMSAATDAELERVLLRPDFDVRTPREARAAFLAEIRRVARRVEPRRSLALCRDPEDDMLFELADAAGADWIVSLDRRVLAVRRMGSTGVVRPDRYLDLAGLSFGEEELPELAVRPPECGITSAKRAAGHGTPS